MDVIHPLDTRDRGYLSAQITTNDDADGTAGSPN